MNGRALVIRLLETTAAVSATDVLFVSAGEEGQLDREILATLRSAGVLTVGESPQFGQLGGMITFVIEADRVRFEINQAAAGRAGLKLSAQLLKLATVVRQEP